MDSIVGLELLLDRYRGDFKSKSEAVLAYAHWKLVAGGLRCVGCGEDFGASRVLMGLSLERKVLKVEVFACRKFPPQSFYQQVGMPKKMDPMH